MVPIENITKPKLKPFCFVRFQNNEDKNVFCFLNYINKEILLTHQRYGKGQLKSKVQDWRSSLI
jgi:hypothetical protein